VGEAAVIALCLFYHGPIVRPACHKRPPSRPSNLREGVAKHWDDLPGGPAQRHCPAPPAHACLPQQLPAFCRRHQHAARVDGQTPYGAEPSAGGSITSHARGDRNSRVAGSSAKQPRGARWKTCVRGWARYAAARSCRRQHSALRVEKGRRDGGSCMKRRWGRMSCMEEGQGERSEGGPAQPLSCPEGRATTMSACGSGFSCPCS